MDYANTEKQSFENVFALTRTFKELKIKSCNSNNKHVILHFDTSNNETPILLAPVIEYYEIGPKITNNYRYFKYVESKSILVCNIRLFRDLEHSNITIIIDRDFYNVQESISNIIAQCEKELDGQPLIEHWKVQFNRERKETGYHKNAKLNIVTIDDSLINDEDTRKIFDPHGKESRSSNILPMALEVIKKR